MTEALTQGTASDEVLAELMGRCALGDRNAFRTLYERTSPLLYALLLRMLKRRDQAEDLLQDVYVLIWRRASEYRADKGRALAWLTAIARYRALDMLRKRGREVPFQDVGDADRWESDEEGPADATSRAAQNDRLSECLETLGVEQRNCIRLAYLQGYTHSEIARTTAAPLGTIKSWVRRGLQSLKKCIEA